MSYSDQLADDKYPYCIGACLNVTSVNATTNDVSYSVLTPALDAVRFATKGPSQTGSSLHVTEVWTRQILFLLPCSSQQWSALSSSTLLNRLLGFWSFLCYRLQKHVLAIRSSTPNPTYQTVNLKCTKHTSLLPTDKYIGLDVGYFLRIMEKESSKLAYIFATAYIYFGILLDCFGLLAHLMDTLQTHGLAI